MTFAISLLGNIFLGIFG